jgi:hypothetical protein
MNKRYVDIDKFKEQIQKAVDNYWLGFSNGYYLAEDVIEEINCGNFVLADVEEIKRGIWKTDNYGMDRSVCSECGATFEGDGGNYCSRCGAKMTGE